MKIEGDSAMLIFLNLGGASTVLDVTPEAKDRLHRALVALVNVLHPRGTVAIAVASLSVFNLAYIEGEWVEYTSFRHV